MKYTAKEVYFECLKHFTGAYGVKALGGVSIDDSIPGTLSEEAAAIYRAVMDSSEKEKSSGRLNRLRGLCLEAVNVFTSYYDEPAKTAFLEERAEIIFNETDPVKLARAVSELWSPELAADNDRIFNSWRLKEVEANPEPYNPEEIIIQLNALYSPAGKTAPGEINSGTAEAYNRYMDSQPEKIAVYDHPVPIFTRGEDHELEKCLIEMDSDIAYEKECGVLPSNKGLKVLISISTTHAALDTVCEMWLKDVLSELSLKHIDCYLLSENKARELDQLLGEEANIFTVQGKYACHFGALKYAQLIFEKAYGIRAGFKLDTDEGIHSRDMKETTGKTWLEQLCHPYWGGSAVNSGGGHVNLGFNIGEYVDSRDMDSLGYAEAIRTPEVKENPDIRGPYLLFNKGACQAKGTRLLSQTSKLDDFISHPLVKGGGYGVDNRTLRQATPVGFSMVGRAEDQQFYFSAVNRGAQGIFNPFLRIIHYKASVVKSEHKHEAGRNIADIYRMLLFRNLMTSLEVVDKTVPFPANYASGLSAAQVPLLWLYLIFKSSAAGDEASAEEYLAEGEKELLPLYKEIKTGKVMELFNRERKAWGEFTRAVDGMTRDDARNWLESLRIN